MAANISLWRIAKDTPDFRANDLTGGGAAAFGGRWNSKGLHVVYASPTIALATLESLAHVGDDIAARNRFLIQIKVPIGTWKRRQTVTSDMFPATWVAEPPGMATIDCGDGWLYSNTSALLVVPSVIIPEESNVLINPTHPDSKKIVAAAVRQFVYDPRLGSA